MAEISSQHIMAKDVLFLQSTSEKCSITISVLPFLLKSDPNKGGNAPKAGKGKKDKNRSLHIQYDSKE